MKYLLDSNVIIAMLNDGRSKPAKMIRLQAYDSIGIPSIVIHELYYGAFKSPRARSNGELVDALNFVTVELDRQDARVAGEVRAYLERLGTPISAYDNLIAGQAMARNLVLVTHNLREFSRVPGLKIEDWEA
jgi:tRNA(fMet)-specific endonuclease VapC